MEEDTREGPTERQVIAYFCTGCKWHEWKLLKASRAGKSQYQSNCNHPSELMSISGTRYGRFIGENQRTPTWCPVLTERKDG